MRIDVVTLFPELFPGPLATGLVGRALREGRAEVGFVDPRRFALDRHRSVDAPPYGGGAGMLMRLEPLVASIEAVRSRGSGPVVLLTPRGRPMAQADLIRWSSGEHLGLVCGRYEGFDARIDAFVDDAVSLGDFVLTGGEYAALAIVDGVIRLCPGTLGNEASAGGDSFSAGRLEYPQYTRPEVFRGHRVPDVLLAGHHGRIEAWRRAEQLELTRIRRPDLLEALDLTVEDRRVLAERPPGRRVDLAAAFSDPGPSAEALGQLARLALAFRLDRVWVIGANVEDRLDEVPPIEQDGLPGPKRRDRPRRLRFAARDLLHPARGWAEVRAEMAPQVEVFAVGAAEASQDAAWSPPRHALEAARRGPGVCLAIGGDSASMGRGPSRRLCPPRSGSEVNALDPVITAALILERVFGEA